MKFVHNKIVLSGVTFQEVGLVFLTPEQTPLYNLVKYMAKHGAPSIEVKWLEDDLTPMPRRKV